MQPVSASWDPYQRFHCHIEATQTKESYQGELATSSSH